MMLLADRYRKIFILPSRFPTKIRNKQFEAPLNCHQHHYQLLETTSSIGNTLTLNDRFKSLRETIQPETTLETYIHRIPLMLRDTKDYDKYFEPRVFSFGPYHHGKENLMLAEPLKLQMVNKFIKTFQKKDEDLYNMIFNELDSLKQCYDEKLRKMYDNEALARMLFVDGCCVLHYIDCYVNSKFNDLGIKDHLVAFVNQDLLLLENQLPFRVLEILMGAILQDHNGAAMEMIQEFIRLTIRMPKTKIQKQWGWWRSTLWQQHQRQTRTSSRNEQDEEHCRHLLELLRSKLVAEDSKEVKAYQVPKIKDLEEALNQQENRYSFRSVTELIAKGIKFKPSETNRLADVAFTPHLFTGHLKLPQITIDHTTKAKFLNLIALEMCLNDDNHKYEVTSYIFFLDSLIDHSQDVMQLRKAGIIYNMLGNDEQVAKLFNEITTDLIVPNSDVYKIVKLGIERHYHTRWKSWIAKLIHEHFNSPWTIVAFIAAIAALLSSLAQTYYAYKSWSSKDQARLQGGE